MYAKALFGVSQLVRAAAPQEGRRRSRCLAGGELSHSMAMPQFSFLNSSSIHRNTAGLYPRIFSLKEDSNCHPKCHLPGPQKPPASGYVPAAGIGAAIENRDFGTSHHKQLRNGITFYYHKEEERVQTERQLVGRRARAHCVLGLGRGAMWYTCRI
jgi:hypothetical protein